MKYVSATAMMVIMLSGCFGGDTSENPSYYSFSSFDYFEKALEDKTIRTQYLVHRTYVHQAEVGSFEGTLLNPQNYPEDDTAEPYYRDPEATEGNFSGESIVFGQENQSLADVVDTLDIGTLSNTEISTLIERLDGNDDFINAQDIFYYERNLEQDFLNGSYYAFNNYFRTESIEIKRYDNFIVHGTGEGHIVFQDGFDIDFSIQTQTIATASTIYHMRDETFPEGFRLAEDSKQTSLRYPGNFKRALTFGGGGQARRFIEKYQSLYQPSNGPIQSNQYAYSIWGEKYSDVTQLVFYAYRPQPILFETQTITDMTLRYTVTIAEGYVKDILAVQTFFQE